MMMEIWLAGFFLSSLVWLFYAPNKIWSEKSCVHSHENHLTPRHSNIRRMAQQHPMPTLFVPQSSCIHILYDSLIVNAIAHCHCLHFPIKTNFFLLFFFSCFCFHPSISIIKRNWNALARKHFCGICCKFPWRAIFLNTPVCRKWIWMEMKIGISAINPIELAKVSRFMRTS